MRRYQIGVAAYVGESVACTVRHDGWQLMLPSTSHTCRHAVYVPATSKATVGCVELADGHRAALLRGGAASVQLVFTIGPLSALDNDELNCIELPTCATSPCSMLAWALGHAGCTGSPRHES